MGRAWSTNRLICAATTLCTRRLVSAATRCSVDSRRFICSSRLLRVRVRVRDRDRDRVRVRVRVRVGVRAMVRVRGRGRGKVHPLLSPRGRLGTTAHCRHLCRHLLVTPPRRRLLL